MDAANADLDIYDKLDEDGDQVTEVCLDSLKIFS